MNVVIFRKFFTPDKIKIMSMKFPHIDFDAIGRTIISNLEMKKKYSQCFLSALQLKYVPGMILFKYFQIRTEIVITVIKK